MAEFPDLAPWQRAWREIVAPGLYLNELRALAEGLLAHDLRIVRGVVADSGTDNWSLEASAGVGCAFGFACLAARPGTSVGEINGRWDRLDHDRRLIAPGGCCLADFSVWFDTHDPDYVRPRLMVEVTLSILGRCEELAAGKSWLLGKSASQVTL